MAKKKRKPKAHKPSAAKKKKKSGVRSATARKSASAAGKKGHKGPVVNIGNSGQFEREILNGEKPAIVDFWAPWCGPCLAMAPIFEAAAEAHHETITFAKVDTESVPKVAEMMGIRSLPTLLVFWEGEVVDLKVGVTPAHGMERLITKLNKRLAKASGGEESSGGFMQTVKGWFS